VLDVLLMNRTAFSMEKKIKEKECWKLKKDKLL